MKTEVEYKDTNKIRVRRKTNNDLWFLYPKEYGYYLANVDGMVSSGQFITPTTANELFVREDGKPLLPAI